MKIKIDREVRGRGGESFNTTLGTQTLAMLDGMAVGSVGDHRKVGRLADRFDEANGSIDLDLDEIKILKDVMKAAKAIRIDLRRSMEYLLWPDDLSAEDQKQIAKWYNETLPAPEKKN